MDFALAWELFTKILWPVILSYAAYLHTQLNRVMQKFDRLHEEHYQFKAQAMRDFVTHSTVASLEDKITRKLDRIDDKITKILEARN